MPRGVYKRKSRTLANLTLGEIFPTETLERIQVYCRGNNLTIDNFIKKAVYNNLPVEYEVTEDWKFPFGKYTGETAGAVAQFAPEYIKWCIKKIAGFNLKFEVSPEVSMDKDGTVGSPINSVPTGLLYQFLRIGEKLKINKRSAWAYTPSTDHYRKLATRWEPEVDLWHLDPSIPR